MQITVSSTIAETPRVLQVRGMLDLAAGCGARLTWDVDLPLVQQPWHLGLIVGPTGCGKSTIARRFWPNELRRADNNVRHWPKGRAVVDGFTPRLSVREVTALLSAVGFASPPAWLRPFHVLSTGQQFRAALARLLAHTPPGQVAVCDEFTSVVDRTVAQVGSAALAKTVRQRGQQFIAVTCHEDVEEWLQPDWVYRPAEGTFTWRLLRRRPEIELSLFRCKSSAWPAFAPHHYLSGRLASGATCFLTTWQQRPVAFSAWLPFLGGGLRSRREHRTVTLPDFQGVGIGHAVSTALAAMWTALGYRARSTTTHPAFIAARLRSGCWRMSRPPSLNRGIEKRYRKLRHAGTRLTAGFHYIGPAMCHEEAQALHAG